MPTIRELRMQAAHEGRKRFYAGPCRQGHDAERYTASGQCIVCAREYMNRYNAAVRAAVRAAEQSQEVQ